jgi:oligosaccharide repeat unit polymerase
MPERKKKILQVVIVFLVLCTLLPFFESLFQIPSAFATENSFADAYETRLAGNVSDYLSPPGRKFFAIIWMFNNVIPVLIFVAIINKLDKRLIVGLCIALVTIWIHSMVLGGRSKLVQNALYIFLVYFFFKGYLSPAMNKKIVAFGSVFMSIALVAVIAVSISRFNTIWLDSTSSMTLWSWLGLYAGEGALNFNCREWNMPGSSDYIIGYATLIVPLSLFSGNIISVFDIWNMKSKLGIPGNQFYTYVGAIFMDYGKFGTLLFLLFFSTVMYFMVIKSSILSGGKRLLFLSLWAKILVVGPIFYTYSTYGDQMNLLWACIFGILFL